MQPIIQVENLGKKYTIRHEHPERYTALRDVMAKQVKKLFSFPKHLRPAAPRTDYEEFWALKDIDFEIQQGDRVGIIGRNGAGKSTLLKILSRITEPSTGRIELNGRVASLLEVGTGFHPELTGRENIFLNGAILGMSRAEIRKKFDEIVDFSGVEKFLDTPVKRYSSGMYVRLAFAVAAHLEQEILVVDEVLAVGDAEFQKKCLGKMEDVSKNEGRTVLFVSHNINMIKKLCSTGILLKSGTIDSFNKIEFVTQNYFSENIYHIKEFKKDLKYVKVEQVEKTIKIESEYNTDKFLDIPNLGFVVSSIEGLPLFGTNAVLDKIIPSKKHYSSGKIEIIINSPILEDGEYSMSIWFGSSDHDYLSEKDCIKFQIIGMSERTNSRVLENGVIKPNTQWIIS
jgi:lipopolysaccharide transport system ATP-binding protein